MKEWKIYQNEIEDYVTGKIQTKDFAKIANISPRYARAFKQKYLKRKETIYVHANNGKKKPRKKYQLLKEKILNIFQNTKNKSGKNPFENVTYRHFLEILEEEKNIIVKETWLKKILKEVKHISPATCKVQKNQHNNRFRKECFGEMLQGDGTVYDWFGDGKLRCIQGFIDDATGIPVGLYMTENECLLGYNEAFMQTAEKYGLPLDLYLDGASVFFVNQKPVSKDEFQPKKITQFAKEMDKLGVGIIRAKTSYAKGKVERFWRTLKLRLVTEFLLHDITNMQDANIYLKEVFIPKIAKRFGRTPKSEVSMFIPVSQEQLQKSIRNCYHGKTDKNGIFTILGYEFICEKLKNQKIDIYASQRDGIYISPTGKDERHEIILVRGDSSGSMPQVMKNLIDEFFLKDAKSPFNEVYYDVDSVVA